MKAHPPLLSAALVLFASGAHASPHRPYDAPSLEDKGASVPPLPTGYLEHREGGVTFAYHPSAHERVRASIASVLRTRAALSEELGREVLETLEIRVAAVPDEMRSLGPTEDVPSYAPALVFSKQRLIVTSLRSLRSLEPTDLAAVLRHALAHAGLDEALEQKAVPLWLHEGYAVHVSGDYAATRAESLLLATLKKRLLPISDLETSFPSDAPEASLAYAEAADLLRFLTDKPRRPAFAAMIERVRNGEPFERAFSSAYDADLDAIESSWRDDLARRFGFLPVFLVGIAIWLVSALVIFLKRAAERRKVRPGALRTTRKYSRAAESAPKAETQRLVTAAPLEASGSDREGMGEPILRETDVPKVEHDGDWHTLH